MNTTPDTEVLPSKLAFAQGAYFLGTGIWPFLSYRSFEWVTGPKKEPWLVKTVGALVGVIGATLMYAGRSGRRLAPEMRFLAMGSAVAISAIESWYAAKRRISPIYAVDGLLEAGLTAAWLFAERNQPQPGVIKSKTSSR